MKRFLVAFLILLLTLCAATGGVIGALSTNLLTPPRGTLQVGPLTMQSISQCPLDLTPSAPCVLPSTDIRWLVQIEVRTAPGAVQQWVVTGGGSAPLRVVRR